MVVNVMAVPNPRIWSKRSPSMGFVHFIKIQTITTYTTLNHTVLMVNITFSFFLRIFILKEVFFFLFMVFKNGDDINFFFVNCTFHFHLIFNYFTLIHFLMYKISVLILLRSLLSFI